MKSKVQEHQLPEELARFRYLTEKEVSDLTGRSVQTLRNDRCLGRGFPYSKMGRSVRYRLTDILADMERTRIETEGF